MYKYDFALSFAGEDRIHAKKLAEILLKEKINVYYDENDQDRLWGKNMYEEFEKVFKHESRFFVPFVSKNYINNIWSKYEFRQSQARDIKSDLEYILPIRIDDEKLSGLNETINYIDLRKTTIDKIAEICLKKLVDHSPIRKLFIFLRTSNPESMIFLESKSNKIFFRVAINKVSILENILNQVGTKYCEWKNDNNFYMNGGYSINCIPSKDPEPHTTFTILFKDDFYSQIHI